MKIELTEELINKIDTYIEDWSMIALAIGANMQWGKEHKEDLSTQSARDYKQALIDIGNAKGQREIYMPKYVLERLSMEK